MPQSVTLSISAGVDKGPTVTGTSKFDIATYGALIEEVICKCACDTPLTLPPFCPKDVEFILVSADKFSTDLTCPPATAGTSAPPSKCVYFRFEGDSFTCSAKEVAASPQYRTLKYPTIVSCQNLPQGTIGKLYIKNDLTIDIKVSVLIVQKSAMCGTCSAPTPK